VKPGQTLAVLASPDFGQAQADARRAQSDFALAEKNLNRLRSCMRPAFLAQGNDHCGSRTMRVPKPSLPVPRARSGSTAAAANRSTRTSRLASPIEGIVVERNINPGQELRPDLQLANSPAMFVITDSVRLGVQLDATESQLASLKRGQKVQLRSSAWPRKLRGSVEAISDFVDPASARSKCAVGHQRPR